MHETDFVIGIRAWHFHSYVGSVGILFVLFDMDLLKEGGSIARLLLPDGSNYAYWKARIKALVMLQLTREIMSYAYFVLRN